MEGKQTLQTCLSLNALCDPATGMGRSWKLKEDRFTGNVHENDIVVE
jgi:hypothetical protein